MFLFGRKKETPEEKQERLNRAYAEMQRVCDQGKEKFDKLCSQVESVLNSANKPAECNVIRFASEPYVFPKLKSYQYFFVDWEIWRDKDTLYIYRSEVEDYPEEYYGGDAPAIAEIPISSIQYFRVEGSTYTETKISGGKISQNRYTGRITQTAIKSQNIERDNRIIKMSILANGIVKVLDFEYSSFDVLRTLLPEKEH